MGGFVWQREVEEFFSSGLKTRVCLDFSTIIYPLGSKGMFVAVPHRAFDSITINDPIYSQ